MNTLRSELFIVFGGGCFGTHHVRSIEKGRARGRISPTARIVMVDRNTHPPALDLPEAGENPLLTFVQSDWLDYMKANWDTLPPTAEAVPAPVAPHLAFDWLVWSLREHLGQGALEVVPAEHKFGGLPYEYLAPAGVRYISAAGWVCPLHCRAPHVCPVTRDVRSWELSRSVREYAASHHDTILDAVVFEPAFRVPGIDALPISTYLEARDRLLDLATSHGSVGKQVVVATVSPCHGAVSLLQYVRSHPHDLPTEVGVTAAAPTP